MRTGAPVNIAIGAVLAALLQPAVSSQPAQLDVILDRATRYVGEFVYRFSNVVAEESYEQETISNRGGGRRVLKSDFLLVLLPGSDEFLPFRDVFEVDGRQVRDREQRLTRLFVESTADAVQQARTISQESARYNLGSVQRTFNNPIITLAVLQQNGRSRFRFSLDKQDRTLGTHVWIVEFREQARPTLIKGLRGRDIPARGQFWIDAETGRILRSILNLNDPSVLATLTTSYRFDERFQMDVPFEMKDQYIYGASRVVGTATYGRFRRFDVKTDEEVRTAPAATVSERRSGITLIEIPAGRFRMGSPAGEAGRTSAERQTEVAIARPFWIGQHEVTQQEWRAVMGANPSQFADCGPRCPVENVSFEDVQRFLAALNEAEAGREFGYRLPTETEWEYACRAGRETPFSSGATIGTLQANFNGKAPSAGASAGVFRERPTRAGGFPPNAWGLSDMHGNVAEWIADSAESSAASASSSPQEAAADFRTVRGGSWSDTAAAVRCAARSRAASGTRDARIGFRLAADRADTPR